jgi:uncharacterized protein YigE (DUF2233 family)
MVKTGCTGLHYLGVMVGYLLTITWLIFHNGFTTLLLAMAAFFMGRLILRRLTGHASSGMKILKNTFILMSFLGFGVLCTFVRSETNYAYFLDSSNSLEVLTENQWIPIENASNIDVEKTYTGTSATHQTVRIRRRQPKIWAKALVRLVPEVVHVFTFKPSNEFYLLAAVNDGFKPLNLEEANERKPSNFIINSCFYDPQNRALGEIIYQGKTYQGKTHASGYFRVINGVPHAGPTSIFQEFNTTPTYSCQAHPSTLKNGRLFSYIEDERMQTLWNQKTYRNLIGERKDGQLVVVVSGNGALLDVKEITQIAQRIGVHHASLFDAGSALQYHFKDGSYSMEFSAFNNTYDLGRLTDRLAMKFFRKKFMQRSPVFIGIKFKQ